MFEPVSPGLTFIIPAYNEENGIVPTVERVLAALAGIDVPTELIVVNDGSKDDTAARLAELQGVRVVSHPINTGYGSAIKTGILCARYHWIGIVDADGTYDIELIPDMVERMKAGFDMVVAARKNVLELDKPMKRFFRTALIKFLNVIVAKRIEDPNSGLRIFNRDMALTFFPFLCNTFSFTTSITIFALGEGYFVHYLPMNYSKREGKSKVRHFRDSLRMMQLILQGITFFNPMKLALLLVSLLAVGGFGPAAALSLAGFGGLGGLWMTVAVAAAVLVMMGILADIIRLTATRKINKRETIITEANRLFAVSDMPEAEPVAPAATRRPTAAPGLTFIARTE